MTQQHGMDVGWLLSTLAQSSAALIAILGGFLVLRGTDLYIRRADLTREVRESTNHHSDCARAHATALAHHDRASRDAVLERCTQRIVESNGSVTAAELKTDGLCPQVMDASEVVRLIADRKNAANEAWSYVRKKFPPTATAHAANYMPPQWSTAKVDLNLEVPAENDGIYELVYLHLRTLRARTLIRGTPPREIQRLTELRQEARAALESRYKERVHAKDALATQAAKTEGEAGTTLEDALKAKLAKSAALAGMEDYPVDAKRAFRVLAFFAAVGLAPSIVVLAIAPSTLGPCARGALAGGFLIGLAATLYMLRTLVKSRKPGGDTPR